MSLRRLGACAGASLLLATCADSGQPRTPDAPLPTTCSEILSRWEAYLADPAMVSCTTRSDCIVVGGQPPLDPCNGHSTIGYCGKAANAAAYAASPAPSLETEFAATCPDHEAHDCGPAYASCKNGKCIIEGNACCHCPPPDTIPDPPIGQWDAARDGADVGFGETGSPDVATPDTGGGEAGGSESGGQ